MGELPAPDGEPRSDPLIVLVGLVGALAMELGSRHQMREALPMVAGTWRFVVHGGLPLLAVAAWEARREPAGRVTCVGSAVVLVPLVVAGVADPAPLDLMPGTFAAAAAVSVALAGASIVHSGRRAWWGLGLGDWRWWFPHHAVLLSLLVPTLVVVTALSPGLRTYYPTWPDARLSFAAFAHQHIGIAVDFLGWEFLFRGFLLFAFARRGDPLLAIFLQAFPFFLLHLRKPEIEMISSFAGGVAAGWFCLRARSFLPLFVIHWTMITVVGATAVWLGAPP
jgi:membrane protease YdiL (CAAX protease family)